MSQFTFDIGDELYKGIAVMAIKHERTTEDEIKCAIATYLSQEENRDYLSKRDRSNAKGEMAEYHLGQLCKIHEKYEPYIKKRE
jgi:plasmid stability protein